MKLTGTFINAYYVHRWKLWLYVQLIGVEYKCPWINARRKKIYRKQEIPF